MRSRTKKNTSFMLATAITLCLSKVWWRGDFGGLYNKTQKRQIFHGLNWKSTICININENPNFEMFKAKLRQMMKYRKRKKWQKSKFKSSLQVKLTFLKLLCLMTKIKFLLLLTKRYTNNYNRLHSTRLMIKSQNSLIN